MPWVEREREVVVGRERRGGVKKKRHYYKTLFLA
jgi:hypothetical protein